MSSSVLVLIAEDLSKAHLVSSSVLVLISEDLRKAHLVSSLVLVLIAEDLSKAHPSVIVSSSSYRRGSQ